MNLFEVMQTLWVDFKVVYSDPTVIKWSMWWSLSLCGYVLVNIFLSRLKAKYHIFLNTIGFVLIVRYTQYCA